MVKDESVVDIVHEDVIDNKQAGDYNQKLFLGSDELLGRGVYSQLLREYRALGGEILIMYLFIINSLLEIPHCCICTR